jgi:3-hydroxybutyryl-CoA dehydratase
MAPWRIAAFRALRQTIPPHPGQHERAALIRELQIGQTASLSRTITEADIQAFATATSDTNPVHFDDEAAREAGFEGRIAHGMLSAGLVSAVLGTCLPGPGTIYLRQSLSFRAPVRIGQTVTATVEITDLKPASKRVTLRTQCLVEGKVVTDGEALVLIPALG